jgi:spore germination protein KA
VGQAVSIVGALVIGDIAVSAGFFSAPGVVITALAGISSFAVPALIDAYIPIRLISVVLSGFFGFYGMGLFMFILLVHLCALRSLGAPYLTPVTPLVLRAWKDVFIRAPWWMMDRRPPGLSKGNKRRMAPGMKPKPPRAGGGDQD